MEDPKMNKKFTKEYECPNCEEDKSDFRERCPNPNCNYEDKTLKNK